MNLHSHFNDRAELPSSKQWNDNIKMQQDKYFHDFHQFVFFRHLNLLTDGVYGPYVFEDERYSREHIYF